MTRENRDGAAQPDTEPTAPRSRPTVLIGLVVAGLLVGGAAGWLVLAPRLLAAPHATVAADATDAHAAHRGAGRRKGQDGSAQLHQLENLVVNPAQTQGTRFLLTTIALETDGTAAVEELTQRDVRVRDELLRLLGARTIGELSDLSAREALKTEIASALNALLTTGRVQAVYMPQFVIQ